MRLFSILLLMPSMCFGANLFYRAHDANSVVLGPICIPEFTGEELFDVDFNTTNLTITIYASGDGVDSAFVYTGVNIDDYDGVAPAWGNPPASAVEVEDDDECLRLHIRDEVLAVSGAVEWTIKFTDAATDQIMDWSVQVLALADSADAEADVVAGLTTFGAATEGNVDANETKIDGVQSDTTGILADTAEIGTTGWIDANGLAADAVNEIVDGLPTTMIRTTIATLPGPQNIFTLTAGSPDDDAYNACGAFITDAVTPTQKAFAGVEDYAGASRTVTLDADPGIFTMAATDNVTIVCLPVTAEFMNKTEILGIGTTADPWNGE